MPCRFPRPCTLCSSHADMTSHHRTPSRRWSRGASVLALMLLASIVSTATGERKFYNDDPIAREPATQDAAGAQPWDINLFYDLSYNLFVTQRAGR